MEKTLRFADLLKDAMSRKDQSKKVELLRSLNEWIYASNGQFAEAVKDRVTISAYPLKGGINTYTELSARVLWEDGTFEHLGTFTNEELRLPNYVPPDERE